MTYGIQLIRAICEEGAEDILLDLHEEFFEGDEDELRALNFLTDYRRRFEALPTPAAFRENGIRLSHAPSGTPRYHLEQCRRRHIYRIVQRHMRPINDRLAERDVDGVAERIRSLQQDLVLRSNREGVFELPSALERLVSSADSVNRARHAVPTSHVILDELVDGLYPGEVAVFAARPNVGKSWMCVLGALAAWRAGYPVLLLSMEMSVLQMAARLVGAESGMNPGIIRRAEFSEPGRERFDEVVGRMCSEGRPRFVLVEGGLRKTVDDLDALIQAFSPAVAYVDASYLMEARKNYRAKWEALAEVNEGIKTVAMRRNIPIVHTVQLNREARRNARGEYDLTSIGGTDVVGQIASLVLFLREGVGDNRDLKRRVYLVKNREGRLGRFTINWSFHHLNFDVVPDDPEDEGRESSDSVDRRRARDQHQAGGYNR